ncbi:hypothetical protein [Nostoc sp.]|uniref:hypothetical protein n=1 Tax=Nostoc sp. TaxID=1180 RepID=UPI002FF86EEA
MYSKNITTTPLATESNLGNLQTDNLALLRSHGLVEYNTPELMKFVFKAAYFARKDLFRCTSAKNSQGE